MAGPEVPDPSVARTYPFGAQAVRAARAAHERATEDPPGAGDGASGLVEEALLDQPRALLGGDLDVARSQHEDLVGDALHAAIERVCEAAGEVDQALGEIGLGALEVEDHGDRVLE